MGLASQSLGQQRADLDTDDIGLDQLAAANIFLLTSSQYAGNHHGALVAEMIIVQRMRRDAVSQRRI